MVVEVVVTAVVESVVVELGDVGQPDQRQQQSRWESMLVQASQVELMLPSTQLFVSRLIDGSANEPLTYDVQFGTSSNDRTYNKAALVLTALKLLSSPHVPHTLPQAWPRPPIAQP